MLRAVGRLRPVRQAASATRLASTSPLAGASSSVRSEVAASFSADSETALALRAQMEDGGMANAVCSAAASIHRSTHGTGGTCLVTGIGKSGLVAARLAASLTSVGCRAQFVHAAEWAHGELGLLGTPGILLAITHSGSTSEVTAVCMEARQRRVPVVAIAGRDGADVVGGASSHTLAYSLPPGALDPFGGVPASSIVAQEMVCNALVRAVAVLADFTSVDFARNHPGGMLGVKLRGGGDGGGSQ